MEIDKYLVAFLFCFSCKARHPVLSKTLLNIVDVIRALNIVNYGFLFISFLLFLIIGFVALIFL